MFILASKVILMEQAKPLARQAGYVIHHTWKHSYALLQFPYPSTHYCCSNKLISHFAYAISITVVGRGDTWILMFHRETLFLWVFRESLKGSQENLRNDSLGRIILLLLPWAPGDTDQSADSSRHVYPQCLTKPVWFVGGVGICCYCCCC